MSDTEDAHTQNAATPDLFNTLGAREDLLHVFLQLLWQKHPPSRRGAPHVLQNVRIPDSILLNHSRAIHWYFTAKDGTIKMKSKKRLTARNIIEHLHKQKPSVSGASSWLISRATNGVDDLVEMTAAAAKDCHSLLADGTTTGVLQNFIDTKSDSPTTAHNSIISANWTPNVLYIEKRVNTLDMKNAKHQSLDDRTTLSEASRFVRVAPLVSTHTTGVLERLCQAIAVHIETIHGVTVTNLVLNVKMDEENQPWVLYCSSIRVMHLSPSGAPSSVALSVVGSNKTASPMQRSRSALAGPMRPSRGRSSSRTSTATPASETQPTACSICHSGVAREERSLLARRHVLFPLSIVQFFSAHPPGTLFNEDIQEGVVPPAAALLSPGLSFEAYLDVRESPVWLDERVLLCAACAAGLESITANLHVDADGGIRVPTHSHPLMNNKPKPTRRQPTRRAATPTELPPIARRASSSMSTRQR